LKNAGVGCYIGTLYVGAFGYADDLSLLAPTRAALVAMLHICSTYASEFNVVFNPGKSKYIIHSVGGGCGEGSIVFNNVVLQTVAHDVHLGNVFGPDTHNISIKKCKSEFYQRVNVTLATFHNAFSWIKYKLFNTFCMSVYGSIQWNFSSRDCEEFYVAWRKCVRRVWGISPRTHCNLLPDICQDLSVEAQLHKRLLKFVYKAVHSQNTCLATCAHLALNGSRSNTCSSINYICHRYNISKYAIENNSMKSIINACISSDKPIEVQQTAGAIRDFIGLRDNPSISYTVRRDVNDIIFFFFFLLFLNKHITVQLVRYMW
jgi:hypothetical protein